MKIKYENKKPSVLCTSVNGALFGLSLLFLSLQTTELANGDLEKYYKALDKYVPSHWILSLFIFILLLHVTHDHLYSAKPFVLMKLTH